MKKHFLFSVLTLLVLSASAQHVNRLRQLQCANPRVSRVELLAAKGVFTRQAAKSGFTHQLDSWCTDDDYQCNHFTYDGLQRLTAVSDSLLDEYYVIDSLSYNEHNQLTRLSGWQHFGDHFEKVYYVDYTYDAAGNIATRTNYNRFAGNYELGGVYTYTYNANNQILLSSLTMGGTVFQQVAYTYSAEGLLLREVWSSYDGVDLVPDEAFTYSYNAQGQLTGIADSTSDDGGDSWDFASVSTYEYDTYGNCTRYELTDHTHQVAERSVYTYDYTIPLSSVLMPWTPEMVRPKTYHNTHACTTEQWYTVDVNHVLQYVCDYLYDYSSVTEGITSPGEPTLTLMPNPATRWVTVSGLNERPQTVQVVDAAGRTVLQTLLSSADDRIDVSHLTRGVYILRAGTLSAQLIIR